MEISYGDPHRILLTYVRAVKGVPALTMERKIAIMGHHFELEQKDPLKLVRELISAINARIEKFGFKINLVRDQISGELQYVFINTQFDEAIQGCTTYSAPELDAIKQLIEEIVNARDYGFSILYSMAKQRTTAVLKQKTSDSVLLLGRLVDDGWIEVSEQDRVHLSSMCLSELRTFLAETYGFFSAEDSQGKLLKCAVCKDIVTVGTKCSNGACYMTYHDKCFAIYERRHEVCSNADCVRKLDDAVQVGKG